MQEIGAGYFRPPNTAPPPTIHTSGSAITGEEKGFMLGENPGMLRCQQG
jgi:hypothetical protein